MIVRLEVCRVVKPTRWFGATFKIPAFLCRGRLYLCLIVFKGLLVEFLGQ